MTPSEQLIRNISDTARWAAIYRARETERPDAVFRDPFARCLAGPRGEHIADSLPGSANASWAWVARTYLFDQFIFEQLQQGVEMVVNLAAGLDARPYRMSLPSSLQWIEVDLPEILAYKEQILGSEKPACALERVRLDLSDVAARRELFARLGGESKKALILAEGLLIYLTADEVGSLARDLAGPASFQRWILEVVSPGLLRMLQKQLGKALNQAGAPLKFGPKEGPGFFIPYGWKAVAVRSPLKAAAKLKRLTFWLKLISMLPDSTGKQGSRPWSGICLVEKQ
ncbi:MAG: SAM-dependent methyltransferase [Candidatus Acidiferrales bacterium]